MKSLTEFLKDHGEAIFWCFVIILCFTSCQLGEYYDHKENMTKIQMQKQGIDK